VGGRIQTSSLGQRGVLSPHPWSLSPVNECNGDFATVTPLYSFGLPPTREQAGKPVKSPTQMTRCFCKGVSSQ
jgi:hypothetical protein